MESLDPSKQKTIVVQLLNKEVIKKSDVLVTSLQSVLKVNQTILSQFHNRIFSFHKIKVSLGRALKKLSKLRRILHKFIKTSIKYNQGKLNYLFHINFFQDFIKVLEEKLFIQMDTHSEIFEKNEMLDLCLQEQIIKIDDDPFFMMQSISNYQLKFFICNSSSYS